MKKRCLLYSFVLIIVLILTNTKSIGQTGVLISVDKNNICPEENILLSVKNYDNPYPYALILVSFDGTNYINLFTPGVGHELQLLTYDPTRVSTIFNYPTTEGNATTSMRRVYYKVEYWDDVEHKTTPKFSNVIFIDVKPSANVHSFGFDNANQLLCLNATALDIIPKNPVGTLFSWYKLTPNALDFVEVPGQINQTTSTLPSSKIKTDTIGVTYYRIIAKYGTECPADTGSTKVTVIPDNTISLSSAVGTNNQTKCINTAITNITYATTGATGASFTGLPAGVTGSWFNNVVTISGTPTVAGTFNYTVTLSGGCSVITTTGIISVTPANTISLSSAVGTNNQTLCINTAITNITYATTGATGAAFTGLPAGVTGSWLNNVVTISGTPSVAGTFNYTVTLSGGCSVITSTGTITSNINTISLSSGVGTNNQTKCINTAITNITYATTGAIGASFTGLPAGVAGSWLNNVVTISGTPTVAGTFNYTVTLTGGCSVITTTGIISVTPANTISLNSAVGTNNQTLCINTAITNIAYATTGATGATFTGLPAGVTGSWLNNVVTISGTPTVAGTFNYTVTLTGGCSVITSTGTIISNINTISLSSGVGTNNQTKCINTAITNITYATTGPTGATFTGLPAGVTGSWLNNVATISGTPSVAGTFNYTVTLTGGCSVITSTGTIISNINTIILSSAVGTNSQTLCINAAITNITYATTVATGAIFTGLPAGVTGSWSNNVVTIKGTPTEAGTFNYTVTLTGGCSDITANGFLTIIPDNTISLSSAIVTINQTLCINTAITNVIFATTGATGATFTGLPAGVTGSWLNNVVTISGTPTVAGTFNYTVTLTGSCGLISANGYIKVNKLPTIIANSNSPYICYGDTLILFGSGGVIYNWDNNVKNGVGFVPKNTLIYNLVGIDINGCQNSDKIKIEVVIKPVAEYINSVKNNLMVQEAMNLSPVQFLGAPPFKYFWLTSSNAAIIDSNKFPTMIVGSKVGVVAVSFYIIDARGCKSNVSELLHLNIIATDIKFEVPNAFMPTADYIENRTLRPSFNFAVKEVKYFKIFNRMGQLVYEVYNTTPEKIIWNGIVNGNIQMSDVYVWIAEISGLGEKSLVNKSGQFLLLK